jgi:murein DD-endopeptidase MepM/ murein hydrolase activator NlpD
VADIRVIETMGNQLMVHYVGGALQPAYPDGRGRYLPRKGVTPPPDEEPDPDPDPDPPADGEWVHPHPGAVLTSPFGPRDIGYHYGIDTSTTTAAVGAPVYTVTETVITQAWDAFEGGNETAGTYVKGHSVDGLYTFTWNHGADGTLAVAAGQTVPAGTQVFLEGATGNVTGTHLHFEIIEGTWDDPWAPPYNNGAVFLDPIPVLAAHGITI